MVYWIIRWVRLVWHQRHRKSDSMWFYLSMNEGGKSNQVKMYLSRFQNWCLNHYLSYSYRQPIVEYRKLEAESLVLLGKVPVGPPYEYM